MSNTTTGNTANGGETTGNTTMSGETRRGKILLVDIGNSFTKWAWFDAPDPVASTDAQAAARESMTLRGHAQIASTALTALAQVWRAEPCPDRIVASSVGGESAREWLEDAVAEAWPTAPAVRSKVGELTPSEAPAAAQAPALEWLRPTPFAGGVHNGYAMPEALGADRWAALIGARALFGAKPVLVVSCGTACTIDLLTASGHFTGGVILPGYQLMQRALHENTAALPLRAGRVVVHPDCTTDAIASGCLHAQAGAIERLWHLHRQAHEPLLCVLAGGAAKLIAPWLAVPNAIHEDLVLTGLARIASS